MEIILGLWVTVLKFRDIKEVENHWTIPYFIKRECIISEFDFVPEISNQLVEDMCIPIL